MSRTLITSKDSKGRHAVSIFEAAYNAAKLDDCQAQLLNERGRELKAGAIELIRGLIVSDQFADEEVASNYTYPDGYEVKPIAEQIEILSRIFGLDGSKAVAYAENLPELPEEAEGWFAVVRWQAIAGSYGEAVKKLFELISENRNGKFKNWGEGRLGKKYLCQSERTKQMFAEICEQQEGDIVIFPAQFGLRHRGKSVRRAREIYIAYESGLGVFVTACMLLTHPEREKIWEQLHIDCGGDEYSPDGDSEFVGAPLFFWNDGKLHFNAHWAYHADRQYGSASGFLPQYRALES